MDDNTKNIPNNTNPNTSTDSTETPFYNVMPKSLGNGPLIKAVLTQPKSNIEQPTGFTAFALKNKVIIIIITITVLLLYPSYYILNKILNKNNLTPEIEDFLKTNANKSNTKINPTQTQTSKEWLLKYFGNELCLAEEECGDSSDPDRDGLKNIEEYKKDIDPNNPDSDQDGIADGDEVNVFSSFPENPNTSGDKKYNDGDYIKGGYNVNIVDKLYTPLELSDILSKMKSSGLHQPTITTVGESLIKIYNFTNNENAENPKPTSTTKSLDPLTELDQTAEAKQDRDSQRSNSIKNISLALLKYYENNKEYPKTTSFEDMYSKVKIFTKVATNPTDPINSGEYIYTYSHSENPDDFILSFHSETQKQTIRTRSKDAMNFSKQEAQILNDEQRQTHLETLRTALLLYSDSNTTLNQDFVFPKTEELQKALIPKFISEIPKDPETGEFYEYQISETFDSFTLKAILNAPPTGRTGYLCNQEECRYY